MAAMRTGTGDSGQGRGRGPWDWCVRAPRRVLIVAGMLCVLFGWTASGLDQRLSVGGFVASGTPSARAEEWAARFGADSPELLLVLHPRDARESLDSPAVRAAGRRMTQRLAAEPGVLRARSYWTGPDRQLQSPDGRFALVRVDLRGSETDTARTAQRLVPRYTARGGPFDVRATGAAWSLAQSTAQAHTDLVRAELIAAPLTFAILAVAFRSLLAALLPVLVGGVSAVGALAVLRVLTAVTDVSVFAVNLIGALGFGLAVDYALFMVARFREERARGLTPPDAARASMRTAGRTVAVSAGTVTAALAALLVFPFSFLRSMAYAGMAVVVLAALTAVIVLPAVLACWGPRVESSDPFACLRWAPAPTIGADSTCGARSRGRSPGARCGGGPAACCCWRCWWCRSGTGAWDWPTSGSCRAAWRPMRQPISSAASGDLRRRGADGRPAPGRSGGRARRTGRVRTQAVRAARCARGGHGDGTVRGRQTGRRGVPPVPAAGRAAPWRR
ncbi:MMPL family transporter [Streptomyces lydicus]|nr:MMPL family transporter [Streptomyces lydicus]